MNKLAINILIVQKTYFTDSIVNNYTDSKIEILLTAVNRTVDLREVILFQNKNMADEGRLA